MSYFRKIMILCSDSATVGFLKGFFFAHEYKVEIPISFEEAIQQLKTTDYDIIIYDLDFIDFNSKFFLKNMKERNQEAEKIIFVEGSLDRCEKMKIEYQANLYFQKPLNPTLMAHRFNKIVDETKKKEFHRSHFYSGRDGKIAQAKLLFVDDELEAREFLEKHFCGSSAGGVYEVALSSSGREAIAKAKQFKPDIVITDMKMPGMRGTEMVVELRKLKNPPKDFILLSAIDTLDQREKAQESKLQVFEKPINLRELTQAIQERAIALGLYIGSKKGTSNKRQGKREKKKERKK